MRIGHTWQWLCVYGHEIGEWERTGKTRRNTWKNREWREEVEEGGCTREEMTEKQRLKHQPLMELEGGEGLCWLGLCQLKSSYGYLGRENPNGKNILIRLTCRQACGAFSWLMIDVRWPRSLYPVPPLDWWSWVYDKKAGWAKPWRAKPVNSTPPPSLHPFLPPGSCPLECLP